jgi:hypothetical protein
VVTGGEGSDGGEAVERMVRCGFFLREREGEREAVKVDLSGLTAVKGKGWFTLGKGIFFEDALFPLTPLRLRLSAKSVKIGASDDFLRTSEARSLQRFSQSFRKIEFQRVNFYSF